MDPLDKDIRAVFATNFLRKKTTPNGDEEPYESQWELVYSLCSTWHLVVDHLGWALEPYKISSWGQMGKCWPNEAIIGIVSSNDWVNHPKTKIAI